MATRTEERLEAFMAFRTKYDALDELDTAMQAGTAVTALLGVDLSVGPPTAVQLNDAKAEYDALRANAAYEGVQLPAMANTILWNLIANEAGGGSAVGTDEEKYEAAYALISKINALDDLNTAVQADGDVSALYAIDYSTTTPTAVQLKDGGDAWETIRGNTQYGYGNITLPTVKIRSALWTEIENEAAA